MMRTRSIARLGMALLASGWAFGCGSDVTLFNRAFANTLSGEVFPLTPGPSAAFVLVRVVNETQDIIEFVVTVEKDVVVVDEQGRFVVDDDGEFVTRPEIETVRLTTQPFGLANELGVLFPCRQQRIARVGLGENLLATDAAAFVGGQGTAGTPGFGIPADTLNPLSHAANNFDCGDTVIFRAVRSTSVAGGVTLQSLLLPGSEQPATVTGPDTFFNYEQFLETQVRENE